MVSHTPCGVERWCGGVTVSVCTLLVIGGGTSGGDSSRRSLGYTRAVYQTAVGISIPCKNCSLWLWPKDVPAGLPNLTWPMNTSEDVALAKALATWSAATWGRMPAVCHCLYRVWIALIQGWGCHESGHFWETRLSTDLHFDEECQAGWS